MKKLSLPLTDHVPRPTTAPRAAEVLALRTQYLTPGLITYYRDPLMLVEGHMQYVWDETGKRYLDAFAGIVTVSVGHCHPDVVAKVKRANRPVAAHDHHLSAPRRRRVRQGAGRAHAGRQRAVGQLFHQFRQRGQRDCHALGPRIHRQPRRHQPAQRLSRRHAGGHGAHRRRHLEVQVQPHRQRQTRHARLLLSLPLWPDLSELRREMRPRRRRADPP